jgi:hypothetical protein
MPFFLSRTTPTLRLCRRPETNRPAAEIKKSNLLSGPVISSRPLIALFPFLHCALYRSQAKNCDYSLFHFYSDDWIIIRVDISSGRAASFFLICPLKDGRGFLNVLYSTLQEADLSFSPSSTTDYYVLSSTFHVFGIEISKKSQPLFFLFFLL